MRETPSYHALLSSSNIILTISPRLSSLVFIGECIPDSQIVTSITHPHYLDTFFLTVVPPENLPQWSWDKRTRILKETSPEMLTDEIRELSILATAKLEAVNKVAHHLSLARLKARTGVDFQDIVYFQKKVEAQRFKDAGYDDSNPLEYPYVLQYADYAGVSLKQAADSILLKAKLDADLFAKTELLRLRYFNKIKSASTKEQLSTALEEFMRDTYVNTKIK